jgi:hypothetical protein
MFYVYSKEVDTTMDELSNTRRKKKVYSVQYKHGYPFFTFYEDGKWITRSAKYYVPVESR